MKKYIRASKLDTFLRYHDDDNNYQNNPEGFHKMYEILRKYETPDEEDEEEEDTVDVPFLAATPEDQDRMIALIKPKFRAGEKGYAQSMYYSALDCDIENADASYCQGVTDAIEALFAEGWVDEDRFRIDSLEEAQ